MHVHQLEFVSEKDGEILWKCACAFCDYTETQYIDVTGGC